ncbi:hypothetical protein POM88_044467 [Heracleum sosnowskyi]|uniref:BHLH domain-containing protein n=1 Tax=Heracleum sosnowskyi TaxID=360622 RepID=A0AAD8H4H5_9APIA|nr:hypothetical protein POM88_044467 [Heracleum sosnowskyi]
MALILCSLAFFTDIASVCGIIYRVRSKSCNGSSSKACREKMRKDKLNDKFIELGAILDPGRPPKIDKSAILIDVARMWAVLTRKHADVEVRDDSVFPMFQLHCKATTVKPRAAVTAAPKAVHQRKVTVKPKTEDLTIISPDTKEEVKKVDKQLNKKKAVEGSLKKKGQPFTSTLTARSKAASGLTKKPKAQIVDIDAADANNELTAVEYVEDMYKFYKLVEVLSLKNTLAMANVII